MGSFGISDLALSTLQTSIFNACPLTVNEPRSLVARSCDTCSISGWQWWYRLLQISRRQKRSSLFLPEPLCTYSAQNLATSVFAT